MKKYLLARCDDCIKFIIPNTCSNDLLSLLKTGYSHSKPEQWREVTSIIFMILQ